MLQSILSELSIPCMWPHVSECLIYAALGILACRLDRSLMFLQAPNRDNIEPLPSANDAWAWVDQLVDLTKQAVVDDMDRCDYARMHACMLSQPCATRMRYRMCANHGQV